MIRLGVDLLLNQRRTPTCLRLRRGREWSALVRRLQRAGLRVPLLRTALVRAVLSLQASMLRREPPLRLLQLMRRTLMCWQSRKFRLRLLLRSRSWMRPNVSTLRRRRLLRLRRRAARSRLPTSPRRPRCLQRLRRLRLRRRRARPTARLAARARARLVSRRARASLRWRSVRRCRRWRRRRRARRRRRRARPRRARRRPTRRRCLRCTATTRSGPMPPSTPPSPQTTRRRRRPLRRQVRAMLAKWRLYQRPMFSLLMLVGAMRWPLDLLLTRQRTPEWQRLRREQ
mmetsp:Transcript_8967/g.19448  ORF Transcript_8967/g.19448 Transcript_8967/m.19448 type:complete len:286 (+) Transcript_8967:1328-2185(+)